MIVMQSFSNMELGLMPYSLYSQVFDVTWPENTMDILLTDPPYGILDVDRDRFSQEEMTQFAKLCKKVMKKSRYENALLIQVPVRIQLTLYVLLYWQCWHDILRCTAVCALEHRVKRRRIRCLKNSMVQ